MDPHYDDHRIVKTCRGKQCNSTLNPFSYILCLLQYLFHRPTTGPCYVQYESVPFFLILLLPILIVSSLLLPGLPSIFFIHLNENVVMFLISPIACYVYFPTCPPRCDQTRYVCVCVCVCVRALLFKEETLLHGMIYGMIEIGKCYGMEMKVEKIEVMRLSKYPPQCRL